MWSSQQLDSRRCDISLFCVEKKTSHLYLNGEDLKTISSTALLISRREMFQENVGKILNLQVVVGF